MAVMGAHSFADQQCCETSSTSKVSMSLCLSKLFLFGGAGLRPEHGRFEQACVADALAAAVALDLIVVDCEDVGDGEVIGHRARRSYRLPNCSTLS